MFNFKNDSTQLENKKFYWFPRSLVIVYWSVYWSSIDRFVCPFLSGYRSVPLKNGYNEKLDLAALLVYINVQQAGVSQSVSECVQLASSCVTFDPVTCPESRGGAVLVVQPAEEEAGGAQRALPVRHTQQPAARCAAAPARPAGPRVQRETQVPGLHGNHSFFSDRCDKMWKRGILSQVWALADRVAGAVAV